MSIFDFLKNKLSGSKTVLVDDGAEDLLKKLVEEFRNLKVNYAIGNIDVGGLIRKYFTEDEELDKKNLIYFSFKLIRFHDLRKKKLLTQADYLQETVIFYILCAIIDELSGFSDEELELLLHNWYSVTRDQFFTKYYPAEKIFKSLLKKIEASGLSEPLRRCLELIKTSDDRLFSTDRMKLNDRIDFVLQGQQGLPIHRHDRLGPVILDFAGSIDNPLQKQKWVNLLNHCLLTEGRTSPTQKWLKEAETLMGRITEAEFTTKMTEWISLVKNLIAEVHKSRGYRVDFLRDINHDLIKALIWCCSFVKNQELVNILDDYAGWAYKKKPGVGSISMKTGTACMFVFSRLPFKEGISRLTRFSMKIKNNTILKSIHKIILEVSLKNGISKDDLEEMGVPDFGIDDQGVLRKQMGDFHAVFSIRSLKDMEWLWEKEGKIQKAIPASVKSQFAKELKNLKTTIREIESLLPVYRDRVEQIFLKQKAWNLAHWRKHYVDHPLMGILARKLIWQFSNPENSTQGIWLNGELVDVNEKKCVLSDETEVRLWHPIGFTTEEIVAWRNFLRKNQITQPFKQAYREIYMITDAELKTDIYSNRFASHVLRQHQFAALCKQRGWQYHLMGQWDSHNTPGISLDKWNMQAQFLVEADWQGDTSEAGIFSYISTDQVRFFRNGAQIKILEVPPLVFSEVMRDADLFVGVTSIGNDPNWQDSGNNAMNSYWREYSFRDLSETAKTRSEILKNLIPRLKIAPVCSFDGKFLRVKGKIRSYKIHMGSGNILMEPDDQYLCIVPEGSGEKSTEKLFLPFEGDRLLSIILSKALLLAEDDQIKDTTITRQIKQ